MVTLVTEAGGMMALVVWVVDVVVGIGMIAACLIDITWMGVAGAEGRDDLIIVGMLESGVEGEAIAQVLIGQGQGVIVEAEVEARAGAGAGVTAVAVAGVEAGPAAIVQGAAVAAVVAVATRDMRGGHDDQVSSIRWKSHRQLLQWFLLSQACLQVDRALDFPGQYQLIKHCRFQMLVPASLILDPILVTM